MAATNNKPQKQMSSNNLYIVLALVTLLAVGAGAIISKNLVASVELNTKVISAKSTATKQLSTDLQAAPALVDSYNSLGSEQKTLSDALPLYADFPDLLVTLDNMSSNAGLTLKSIAPNTTTATSSSTADAAPVGAGNASTAPFSISFEGTYASLTRMLNQLETSARPMRVLDISLSGTGSDLTGSMDVDTFYQPAATMPFSTETIH